MLRRQKQFVEIRLSSLKKLDRKTIKKLESILRSDKVKLSDDNYRFAVSKSTTGFENSTPEECEMEKSRRYAEYLGTYPMDVDSTEAHIVDIQVLLKHCPYVRFEVIRCLYVK